MLQRTKLSWQPAVCDRLQMMVDAQTRPLCRPRIHDMASVCFGPSVQAQILDSFSVLIPTGAERQQWLRPV